MTTPTHIVFAASYRSPDLAEADYWDIQEVHRQLRLLDYYDLALTQRPLEGRIRVRMRHEYALGVEPSDGIGLATALVLGAFPTAVLNGGGGLGLTTIAAMLGAMTGHATMGVTDSGFRAIGDLIEADEAGLVLVCGADAERHLELGIVRADKVLRRETVVDHEGLKRALREVNQPQDA